MRLYWVGIAVAALSALPTISEVVYVAGSIASAPIFSVGSHYIVVGSTQYPILVLPYYLGTIIAAVATAFGWLFEAKLRVRPKGGAVALSLLAVALALPLPLIFYENNLNIIIISNILRYISPLLYLLSIILGLIEHYIYINRKSIVIADLESVAEKTQKV
ncbi:MAG: hypothetical protein TU35_004030 [Thermoproteus sp. AZ2]|uniref:Uncharacterized protein n=1 Tax=Thermoproteus sp. AZ2 TaxID=1609232 RepID=A0ACC6V090_9CREN|nr:MAG: hypothetical protein TU35_01295 [Thermoproteus sp. AZ2]